MCDLKRCFLFFCQVSKRRWTLLNLFRLLKFNETSRNRNKKRMQKAIFSLENFEEKINASIANLWLTILSCPLWLNFGQGNKSSNITNDLKTSRFFGKINIRLFISRISLYMYYTGAYFLILQQKHLQWNRLQQRHNSYLNHVFSNRIVWGIPSS